MARLVRYQLRQQHGVVLVVSLVFLIALTGVAVALMQNTTFDMKMSGASEEKVIATQEAISSVDEVIYKQRNGNNLFALPVTRFDEPLTVAVKADDTSAKIELINNNSLEADCPHSKRGSSVQVFTCNVLNVQVQRNYGRKKQSNVEVNSHVAQELLR